MIYNHYSFNFLTFSKKSFNFSLISYLIRSLVASEELIKFEIMLTQFGGMLVLDKVESTLSECIELTRGRVRNVFSSTWWDMINLINTQHARKAQI